jgi:hypothetical protein
MNWQKFATTIPRPPDIAWLQRVVWTHPPKVWCLFWCFRVSFACTSAAAFVLVFSIAPDLQRYLYSVVKIQPFSDFMPPLLLMALLVLCGYIAYWGWQQPITRIERMILEDNRRVTPRPFEDTNEGMEL